MTIPSSNHNIVNNGETKNTFKKVHSKQTIENIGYLSEGGEGSQTEFNGRIISGSNVLLTDQRFDQTSQMSNQSIPNKQSKNIINNSNSNKNNNNKFNEINAIGYNLDSNRKLPNEENVERSPKSKGKRDSSLIVPQSGNKRRIPLSPTPSTNSIFQVNRQVFSLRNLVVDQLNNINQNLISINNNYGGQKTIFDQSNLNGNHYQKANNRQQAGQVQFYSFNDVPTTPEQSLNLLEIGVSLFNSASITGLSFLILFRFVKPEAEDIVRFLMQNPLELTNIKDSVGKAQEHRNTHQSDKYYIPQYPQRQTQEEKLMGQYQQYPTFATQQSPQFNQNIKQFDNGHVFIEPTLNSARFVSYEPNSNISSSSSIPQFYQDHSNSYFLKRSKQAITSILTDLSISENPELLSQYSTFFNFSSSSFCSALRYFVEELQLENDPEQIDVLLGCFAKKFFLQNRQQSTLFESADAVHMLAFATFMLDIDIHFHKEPNLSKLISEFNLNIQGINDGKNFSQDFVSNIIENVLDKKIASVVSSKLAEKQRQHYLTVFRLLLHERAQLVLTVQKISNSKNLSFSLNSSEPQFQQNQSDYLLFIIDKIAIIVDKDQPHSLHHFQLFSMLSVIVNLQNQQLILKPAAIFGKQAISVVKLDQATQGLVIKQKSNLQFQVKNQDEAKSLDQKLRQLFQPE